ncbi:YncE family protein [Oceanobacter sp. 3_MG-2023]|uniref:YncE family protein n=1 Tax=Oceanobacter sp. 3_MG-2023 TaxID=3062622 RepID=UPI0027364E7D|nr:DUF1513 domain-containing protein [Oceanobacter sp. 3_MG-2023]MDP2504221.1 DUF1513 domain-containing protein [Oceanobacter sp. 3_MG-2023]
MTLSRRNLLGWLAAVPAMSLSVSALSVMATGCSQRQGDLLLGGGRFMNPDGSGQRYVLALVDLQQQQTDLIDLDFFPHGIHWHPDAPDRLAVFEKKGPHAAEVDLGARRLSRKIDARPGRYFYGHGAYSADNQQLFSTETRLDGLEGVIAVRDADSLAYLGEFPSYGKEPHECTLIDNGKTLVITNAGGPIGGAIPCVCYVDVASQQLLERVVLTRTDLNTGHVAIAEDGSLVVVSAPRTGMSLRANGGVSIRPQGLPMASMTQPEAIVKRMTGEALSVAIANGMALVTHPDADLVTFWSIAEQRMVHSLTLVRPRGVTLTKDGRYFLVTYDRVPKILKIAVADVFATPEVVVASTYVSGSHLFAWPA